MQLEVQLQSQLEAPCSGTIGLATILRWSAESGHTTADQSAQRNRSGLRSRRSCDFVAGSRERICKVPGEICVIEYVETFTQDLETKPFRHLEASGDPHIEPIVWPSDHVIALHGRQDARPALSKKTSEAIPYGPIRGLKEETANRESRRIRPSGLQRSEAAETVVTNQGVVPFAARFSKRWSPYAIQIQPIRLVGGGTPTILKNIELIKLGSAAKRTLGRAAVSKPSSSRIGGPGQRVGQMELRIFDDPAP